MNFTLLHEIFLKAHRQSLWLILGFLVFLLAGTWTLETLAAVASSPDSPLLVGTAPNNRVSEKPAHVHPEKMRPQGQKMGVDVDAMKEASLPDQRPRHIVSSHAYEAFLRALRFMDAGDFKAARHWLRQVLAFDPEAAEARQLLGKLESLED